MKTVSGISHLSMMSSGVYIIVCNANNKFYIGSSRCLSERFEQQDLQPETKEMKADVKKYGSDNFSFDILCTCNYKITTLIENYYIKKYEAIKRGYNMISASKNLKKGRGRYNYIPKTNESYLDEEARLDYEHNKMLDLFMLDMFDYQNEDDEIAISLMEILNILEFKFNINLSEDITPIIHVLYKLDLDIYIKHNENDVYIISGKEIFNFLKSNVIHSSLKSDSQIDEKLKVDICRRHDLNDIFVKCPKLHRNFKYNTSYQDFNEFESKYNITDIRYSHYLNTKRSSNFWQYKLIPYNNYKARKGYSY
jgi:predicted GIY-YIG superfamily endonuclease